MTDRPIDDVEDLLPVELGFLSGGGEATRLILARDWAAHPLGPPQRWPVSLKTALSLVLNSPESMILCWDREELTFFFNETYFPLLGPRLDWAMGAPFREVWADALDQAMPIVEDAFAGNSQHFTDLPWKLATDRGAADTWWSFSYSRILDERGEIAGLFIFTNETTKRVLADRDLLAAQEELRALNASLATNVAKRTAERDRMWNTSPDLMAVLDHHGRFSEINPAWTALLGYDRAEVVGHSAFDLLHPDDISATEGALITAQTDTLPAFENRYRHKDGSYRWLQWVAAPSPDEIFAIGRDVSAEKEARERLAAAEEQLRQAQKMEAVGQLTGGIAHDFNNMLTGVIGSLDMLRRRLGGHGDERAERYIDAATSSAQRAAALTHRLLAFSRRQSLDVRPTDVTALVLGLEDLLRRTLGENIALDLDLPAANWPALTDANQLESAILNLAINARDAMPDGGRLTVTITDCWMEQDGDRAAGDYVCVSVRGTGSGMDVVTRERAFEPFYTTKPIGTGTGLGLSMIYGFVQQTGGNVTLKSAPGAGTEVMLCLPRSDAGPGGAVEPSELLQRAAHDHAILVVEDELIVRMLLVEVLEEMGYRVVEAGTADEALSLLAEMERIDMLVTDVGLPGMNGRDLAEAVRQQHPGLPVLFATGYAERASDRAAFLDRGMEMIAKPFVIDELTAMIARMIEGGE